MNPPRPEPGVPHRHHHQVNLHLDPRHHHHIHIHLCHHLLGPAPPASLHHHQQHPAPVLFPSSYPTAAGAPWEPEPPRAPVAEDVRDLDPEPELLHAEEAGDDDEEPVFVLTEEWAEFFAKSEAERRLAKQQQKKNKGRK